MHLPDSLATIKDSGVRSGRGGGSSSSGCGRVANWGDMDRLPAWHNTAGELQTFVETLRADCSCPTVHQRWWLNTSELQLKIQIVFSTSSPAASYMAPRADFQQRQQQNSHCTEENDEHTPSTQPSSQLAVLLLLGLCCNSHNFPRISSI